MKTVLLRRVPASLGSGRSDALIPADDESAAAVAKVPLGTIVAWRPLRDRSLPQHRLYWALLQHVAEATRFESAERLHTALKIRMGRYDLLRLPNGKDVPVPQSTSFDAMSQHEFQAYFDEAVRLICTEVIPGADGAALIDEVAALIGALPERAVSERVA